jgi:hypothetical protein
LASPLVDDDQHPFYLTRGVLHCDLCHLHTSKSIFLQAKEEELWKLKYFTMQKYNLQKILQNKTKILQDIITLVTNLKFQHKPKYIIFQKSSYKNK